MHQSDLKHGVEVLGEDSTRWSWIMWFRDSVKAWRRGKYFQVGILLDFVRLTTRAEGPHGAASHVRGAKRNRIDRHPRLLHGSRQCDEMVEKGWFDKCAEVSSNLAPLMQCRPSARLGWSRRAGSTSAQR